MTTTEPRLFRDALEDTLAAWPDMTGQAVPPAIFCGAEHPTTGALCARIACDGHHAEQGEDPWTTAPATDGETR